MRYFTPELIERFGALDDAIADAAQREWDETSWRYREHLARIGPQLPREFRALLADYRLHDARVMVLGVVPDATSHLFRLELVSETAPEQPLILSFVLAPGEQARCTNTADLSRERDWLYDEVDIVSSASPPIFSHTILFADGLEVVLHFTDFQLAAMPLSARA